MNIKERIKKELLLEASAIEQVAQRVDDAVVQAVDLLYNCTGKVVVTGMGKTGIVARKIAATLASTGTTSIFLHAAEGIHGDLGIIAKEDVVIAVSNSGNSSELISIIPFITFHNIPIIALTGNCQSQLAKQSTVVLDCAVPRDYEPFGLVPTASTTVALAMGDALAVALLHKKKFTKEDFARFHPGGTIGKRLLLKVEDLMHANAHNPVIGHDASLQDTIVEMTSKDNLGCTSVTAEDGTLIGIVTDGDLRRLISRGVKHMNIPVQKFMTASPKRITPDLLAVKALRMMEDYKITMLPVVDAADKPVGMLHMHDLIQAGVVS
ncbi:MAG: KpsF/GutQ family sugar-phosphate isomerase [Candidatus Cloacimonetes bacterium]|nr:KpsF/GutQ family sugar-phosphate isomerase [Candidatus Cloacimonadota bacterium]